MFAPESMETLLKPAPQSVRGGVGVWLPLPLLFLGIVLLGLLNLQHVYESPLMLPLLNIGLLCGGVGAALLAAWGYHAGGTRAMLLLGAAMLTFGLSSLAAALFLPRGMINAAVTAYNLGALLAGLLHLASALEVALPAHLFRPDRPRLRDIADLYLLCTLVIGALTLAAAREMLPTFVGPTGSTPIREIVLTLAIAAYFAAAALFAVQARRTALPFLRWYWVGLACIGLGLLGVSLAKVGTPLGWTGRAGQMLGQLYLIISLVIAVCRRAGHSAGQRLGVAFRHLELEYRALLEAAAEGIWLIDPQGIILLANRQFAALLGLPNVELSGRALADYVELDARWPERAVLLDTLTHACHQRVELRYRAANGHLFWAETNTSPLVDANGHFLGILGLCTDITERRQAEAEREHLLETLAYQSQELLAILENTDMQMAVLDRDFTITAVNSAYIAGTGLSRDALIGHAHFALFPNDENLALFTRVRETGVPYRAMEKPFVYADQPDRGVTYWNWVFTPVTMPDGTANHFLLSLTDVTEQVQARQELERLTRELQRHAAQLEAIMMSQAHGMVVYAPNGDIVTTNRMAEVLLRYQPQERDLMVEERAVAFSVLDREGQPMAGEDTPTARALRGETAYGTVMALQWPDRVRWVSVSAAPIRLPNGESLGAVASFTDVTELHALQEQMKTFIHMVSHDLRAPLTVIQGYVSVLRDDLSPATHPLAVQGIEAIDRSTRRLNMMIEDLVAAARLEGDQLALSVRPVALQAFLPELVSRNAAVLDAGRVVLDLPADLPPALADEDRLERVLLNLLTNACKYSTPDTPIRVSVRQEDGALAIRVADQGQGVHPDDLPHLFDKFFRARNERRADGIGLGLYITRLLVKAHGGSITAHSTPGHGSTFTVTLPSQSSS